jgi:small subunit ribosomal protein S17
MKKSIGINVKVSDKKCNDKNCPFHGKISLRGRTFTGKVIKVNIHKTATIEWPRSFYLQKYERYEKRRSRVKAHKPDCVDLKVGDVVKIVESKPISKTKNFVIVEVLK